MWRVSTYVSRRYHNCCLRSTKLLQKHNNRVWVLHSSLLQSCGASQKTAIACFSSKSNHENGRPSTSTLSMTKNRPRHNTPKEAIRFYAKRFQELRQEITTKLVPLPPVWETQPQSSASSPPPQQLEVDVARRDVIRETINLLRGIERDVNAGLLEPSGRHSSEMSIFMDCILSNLTATATYSQPSYPHEQSPPTNNPNLLSANDHCMHIMKLMKTWKLNLQNSHCDSIIQTAAMEGRWQEAAELFSARVDPNGRGASYNPISISVENPVGLYCIARFAQLNGTSPVESVFHAVLHMSMVSPTDQDGYVLAAGTALGHAGEAKAMMDYMKSSLNAKQFGQPLIASTMHACLLCHCPDDALHVFDSFTGGEHQKSVEWQWGGGQEQLLPICRDLVIRALGTSAQTNTTKEVLSYLEKIEQEECTMSLEALLGILSSCEKDGEWSTAVNVFFSLVQREQKRPHLVRGSALDLPICDAMEEDNRVMTLEDMVLALDSTMRVCNSSRQFGAALLCAQRFALWYSDLLFQDRPNGDQNLAATLESIARMSANPSDVIATSIVALYGAQCVNGAHELLALLANVVDSDCNDSSFFPLQSYSQPLQANRDDLSEAWENILYDSKNLMTLMNSSNEILSEAEKDMCSFAVAKLLRQICASGNSGGGLMLLSWVADTVADTAPSKGFLFDHSTLMQKIAQGESKLNLTDSLLAAAMEATTNNGDASLTLKLYESSTCNERRKAWLLSSTEAIKALFDTGRRDDALAFFEHLLASKRKNMAIFHEVALKLFQAEDHNTVMAVYKRALSSGCLSDGLSLLAMESVKILQLNDVVKVQRNMATAAGRVSGGIYGTKWVENHYWELKNRLPFGQLRFLMLWDKKDTAKLDELQLVLEIIKYRSESNLAPDEQALQVFASTFDKYHEGIVPSDKTEIPLVPRSPEAWMNTYKDCLLLAEQTRLLHDGKFMSQMANGLMRLGYRREFVELVNDCLLRGVSLRQQILDHAISISENNGDAVLQTAVAFYPSQARTRLS